jgi:hypothetical protein
MSAPQPRGTRDFEYSIEPDGRVEVGGHRLLAARRWRDDPIGEGGRASHDLRRAGV